MSRDMVYEDVPRLSRRVGDNLLAGQNNATVLLGRDRLGPVDSGYGAVSDPAKGVGSGAIHLIVGRVGENPTIADDAATLYMSAKNDPDVAAGTESIGDTSRGRSAIIARADCVRVSSRVDVKVSVGKAYVLIDSGGRVTIEGDVSLGEGAAERIIRGEEFAKFWATVTVPTPMGPSGPPPPIPNSAFSPRNKVR